jgi:hypothetical protein
VITGFEFLQVPHGKSMSRGWIAQSGNALDEKEGFSGTEQFGRIAGDAGGSMRATLVGWSLAGMLAMAGGVGAQGLQGQAAQVQPGPARNEQVQVEDGGVFQRFASIVIPPKANAPFVSTLQTEWVRTMADGGSVTLVNERKIARDGSGKIYQERWWLVPKNGNAKPFLNAIEISDPSVHTIYTCWTQRKVCEIRNYWPTQETEFKFDGPSTGPIANDKGYAIQENLGKQLVAGVETQGVRESVTYNPGAFGNDKTLTVAREFWYSAELGMNLISKRSDPRVGTQTFTIANLSLAEPDAGLFEVPQGYQVVDMRPKAEVSVEPK